MTGPSPNAGLQPIQGNLSTALPGLAVLQDGATGDCAEPSRVNLQKELAMRADLVITGQQLRQTCAVLQRLLIMHWNCHNSFGKHRKDAWEQPHLSGSRQYQAAMHLSPELSALPALHATLPHIDSADQMMSCCCCCFVVDYLLQASWCRPVQDKWRAFLQAAT